MMIPANVERERAARRRMTWAVMMSPRCEDPEQMLEVRDCQSERRPSRSGGDRPYVLDGVAHRSVVDEARPVLSVESSHVGGEVEGEDGHLVEKDLLRLFVDPLDLQRISCPHAL